MEDDRVILLNNSEATVDDDLNLTDPTGMFSLTEITGEPVNSTDDANHNNKAADGDHEPSSVIYVAAVIAALGGLLFGYDIGVISGAKIQIQKEIGFSCTQIEVIVAMLPVGATTASLIGGEYCRGCVVFY